jgi:hypothetical protein
MSKRLQLFFVVFDLSFFKHTTLEVFLILKYPLILSEVLMMLRALFARND